MQQKGLDFGAAPAPAPPKRRSLTVSQLTDRIQGVLETELFDVWVEGEISNLKIAPSGHWYFSLKDDRAQVRAVVWKTATRLIKFKPRDGMKVVARGGLKVYPPRGEYQLSVEVLEPLGKGSLQQRFEDLKQRLEQEGLFDKARKRPLPLLPRRLGIVTSPTGAVVQDVLRVLSRRFPNLDVLIYPARVQGPEAAGEIMRGIAVLNRIPGIDVLMVARGGGSLEDLWPFNEEQVARAIVSSRIPVISAVGHETDFTIADFVADLRAATPSAGAEHVVQDKRDLCAGIDALHRRLDSAASLRLGRARTRLAAVAAHRVLTAERGRVRNLAQRVDELTRRSELALQARVNRQRLMLARTHEQLEGFRWDRQVQARRELVVSRLARATQALQTRLTHRRSQLVRADEPLRGATALRARLARGRARLAAAAGKLDSLSPLAVLARGYALVWTRDGRLVRGPGEVGAGDTLSIRVEGGRIAAVVTGVDEEPA